MILISLMKFQIYKIISSNNEIKIDEFESYETDLNKFKETLFPKVDEEKQKIENQFRKAALYALQFEKNGEKSICTKQDFEKVIHKDLLEQLDKPKEFKFNIQLQAFLNICYKINANFIKICLFFKSFWTGKQISSFNNER